MICMLSTWSDTERSCISNILRRVCMVGLKRMIHAWNSHTIPKKGVPDVLLSAEQKDCSYQSIRCAISSGCSFSTQGTGWKNHWSQWLWAGSIKLWHCSLTAMWARMVNTVQYVWKCTSTSRWNNRNHSGIDNLSHTNKLSYQMFYPDEWFLVHAPFASLIRAVQGAHSADIVISIRENMPLKIPFWAVFHEDPSVKLRSMQLIVETLEKVFNVRLATIFW